jgi:Ca-activated chloride channel family protein
VTPEGGFVLLRPGLLAVALLALPLVAVGLYGRAAARRGRARLVAPRHAARFLPGHSEGRGLVRLVLAAAACALVGLALAGPVRGFTMRSVTRRGLDLVVCIDTSNSMLVRDIRPDRLTRALREVGGLIDRLRGDRMALIAFSGEAREVAPLTHDRTTLRALLERVTPEDNRVGGTSLGAALSAALSMFDGRTGAHEAIVVLTDGEDLAGEGLAIAATAAERGIRVYVVGMGTEQGGKIPLTDAEGEERFLTDRQGVEVVSALSGETLRELARKTGGDYLAASRSPAPLEELYQMRISRLEGRALDGTEWVPHDRYQWALALALACMLIEAGLRERTRASAGAAALLVLPLGPFGAGARPDLAELERRALAGEREPTLELAAALAADPSLAELEEPERAEVLYALGVARHLAGERDAAAADFLAARDLAGPGELRAEAAYDLAAMLLEAAEEARAEIPELQDPAARPSGVPSPPPVSHGPSGPPPPDGEAAPDALDVAEAAYRVAREAHLDRVRLGAPDADTRANLELCQRRLRELEELRRQREEEQQQQQQQQQQQGEQGEPGEEPPPDEGGEQEQQEPETGEGEEPEGEQPEPEPEQEPLEASEQEGEAEQPEPEPGDEAPEEQAERDAEPKPGEVEERLMSREEVLRLLDQLAAIEEEAREVQRALAQRRRVPVEQDW